MAVPQDGVLAFNDPLHDSSFCIYSAETVTHVESERVTRRKYEFVNPILTFCALFPEAVEQFHHIAIEDSTYSVAPFLRRLLAGKGQGGRQAVADVEGGAPYAWELMLDQLEIPPVSNDSLPVLTFLRHLLRDDVNVYFCGHHASHAANAFFSSGFSTALTITLDGGGFDYALESEAINVTRGSETAPLRRIYGGVYECGRSTCEPLYQAKDFSFGFAWSRVTNQIFGLPDGDEGTVMAMAAYGDPERFRRFFDEPWVWLPADVDLSEEMKGRAAAFTAKVRACLREEQDTFDVAAALQAATEKRLREYLSRFIGPAQRNVCLSGGSVLNCQMIGKLQRWFPQIERVFIPPAPYDGGISIGAAQLVFHGQLGRASTLPEGSFASFAMGRKYSRLEIVSACRSARARMLAVVPSDVLHLLQQGKVIGLFCDAAESGRRALGHRSIIADPRRVDMKERLNQQIKHRQWFRPFAPMVLAERAAEWFECGTGFASPYMSFAVPSRPHLRDRIPAVLHADGTARVQTVHRQLTPELHALLSEWHSMTGVPILLNTSFNEQEPIVETPADALNTMRRTGMDGVYFADIGIFAATGE